jgi:murein DD-endopeptidase MepM/ murein hydrolase activator NlpD
MRPAAPLTLVTLLAASAAAGQSGVSSGFGVRSDPFASSRAVHRGVDLRAAAGTPVLAAAGGVVRLAGWRGGYGLMIELVHADATATRYAHLSRLRVRPSQIVMQGEPIGDVGSTGRATGSHLHFEYLVGGAAVDPLPYFGIGIEPAAPPTKTVPHRSAFAAARDREASASQALPDGPTALRRLAR